MAEREGVVDIYNCVKALRSRRINMVQTEVTALPILHLHPLRLDRVNMSVGTSHQHGTDGCNVQFVVTYLPFIHGHVTSLHFHSILSLALHFFFCFNLKNIYSCWRKFFLLHQRCNKTQCSPVTLLFFLIFIVKVKTSSVSVCGSVATVFPFAWKVQKKFFSFCSHWLRSKVKQAKSSFHLIHATICHQSPLPPPASAHSLSFQLFVLHYSLS